MPVLATLGDPHCWRWPCPTWRSPHHPSIRKGEDFATTPPVPSRNHKSPVVCEWMCLLARHKQSHRRSTLAVWDLHLVTSPKCCSTPHSYASSSHPWQMCTTDIFTLEGIDYLICGNFYLKMIHVWCLPSGQSNTVKVISLLKEMFSEHGIPKVLCSDNSPQYVSAQFTEFYTSWGITHDTSSPHCLQLNGFAKVCVKSVKHALQCTKYSNADPKLTLLVLWATPINTKLHHLLSSCTDARFGPPFLPEFATLILQPSRFANELMPAPMPPNYRQTNDANLLHPCMLASLLWCMTPSVTSGSLSLWYMSCWKTATKCTPVKAWSTTAGDNTSMNAVSSPVTLPQMSHLPHHRLLPDLTFLCHCLHLPSLHNCCSLHLLHLWLWNHRHQLFLKLPLCLCLCLWHPA